MAYELMPYVGVGPIRLGMTREEIRKAVGAEVKEFTRWNEGCPGDSFGNLGITIGYREPGICEFIELSGPVAPTFQGEGILGRPYCEVKQWFEALDPTATFGKTGLRSYRFGITVYARAAVKELDKPVEAVSLFEAGYYERYGEGA